MHEEATEGRDSEMARWTHGRPTGRRVREWANASVDRHSAVARPVSSRSTTTTAATPAPPTLPRLRPTLLSFYPSPSPPGPAYATQSPLPMASRPPPRTSFVRRRPFLAFGLPFMTLIAGSSFFLERFTRTRYAEMNRFAWVSQHGRLMFVPPPPALCLVRRCASSSSSSPLPDDARVQLRASRQPEVLCPWPLILT